jgi:hypothetical protein
MHTLVPLCVILLLVVAAICHWRRAKRLNSKGESKQAAEAQWLGNLLMYLVFFILFLIYPGVATRIFRTFQCKELDDGSQVLMADFAIDCSSDAHRAMMGYAVLMLFVYPLGAPTLYAYLLFVRCGVQLDQIKSMHMRMPTLKEKDEREACQDEIEEKKAKIEEKKAEIEEKKAELPDYVQKLIFGYALHVFYFEIIECFRKLAIVCMPVFFDAGTPAQLIFGLLICFLTAMLYSNLRPYARDGDTALALVAQANIFFNLLSSVALSYGNSSAEVERNMDVLLVVLMIVPFAMAIILELPRSVLDKAAGCVSQLPIKLLQRARDLDAALRKTSKDTAKADKAGTRV